MAWLILALRKSELQASLMNHTLEQLKLKREMERLSSFTTAVADGNITPSEIASLGSGLFGDATDFMGMARDEAEANAQMRTDQYTLAYNDVTKDQLVADGLALYANEDGSLNEEAMFADFYEDALKEYANTYFLPRLNEMEKQMENRKAELDALVMSENAELESLESSLEDGIRKASELKLS